MDDDLIHDREFVLAAARCGEGLITEADLRKRYRHLDASAWDRLANDEELIEAIQDEKAKRIRSGQCAREKAQVLFAAAPTVLGEIMNNDAASPRHRIESAKELRVVAANAGDTISPAAAAERFTIVINMGSDPGDTLTYSVPNKTKQIEHNDTAASGQEDNGGEFL